MPAGREASLVCALRLSGEEQIHPMCDDVPSCTGIQRCRVAGDSTEVRLQVARCQEFLLQGATCREVCAVVRRSSF